MKAIKISKEYKKSMKKDKYFYKKLLPKFFREFHIPTIEFVGYDLNIENDDKFTYKIINLYFKSIPINMRIYIQEEFDKKFGIYLNENNYKYKVNYDLLHEHWIKTRVL
jgi:hypothetical protein